MMADEATQGIDPDGSERIMEEAHVIPLWQGINPAVNDSEWCWFRQTSIESHLGNMSVASDFWSAISVTRVAETGVHG